jgi:hypothetical protein
MQLREARLCLDCEELHRDERCPACASDAFAFLSTWVPTNQRAQKPQPRPRPAANRAAQVVAGGAFGLAMLAAARWLVRTARPSREA